MGQNQTQLALRGKEQDARNTQLQEYMVRKVVAEQDCDGLRQLVRYVDVNGFLASGETLLVFAIKEGWVDAVQVLLEAGADPGKPDLTGSLPLHTAVLVNNSQIISELVHYKGTLNKTDETGVTALQLACCKGHADITGELLKAGAQPDLPTKSQEKSTALMICAAHGYEDCAKVLLEWKADPNLQDYRGHTAISKAAVENYPKVVNVLLKYDANADLPNRTKTTPVQLATIRNFFDVVQYLLDGGSNPAKSSTDLPPLHAAALNGCCECAKQLLRSGVRIEGEDNQRRTALFSAMADMPHVEHHYRYNPLQKGTSRLDVAQLLIQHGADVGRVWRSRFCFTRQRSNHQVAQYKLAMRACQPLNMNFNNLEELLQKIIIVRCADGLFLFRAVFPQISIDKIAELLSGSNGKWEVTDSCSDPDECPVCLLDGDNTSARECRKLTKDDILTVLEMRRSNPLSLKHLCRKRMRKVLSKNVPYLVKKLNISDELQNYVCLKSLVTYT